MFPAKFLTTLLAATQIGVSLGSPGTSPHHMKSAVEIIDVTNNQAYNKAISQQFANNRQKRNLKRLVGVVGKSAPIVEKEVKNAFPFLNQQETQEWVTFLRENDMIKKKKPIQEGRIIQRQANTIINEQIKQEKRNNKKVSKQPNNNKKKQVQDVTEFFVKEAPKLLTNDTIPPPKVLSLEASWFKTPSLPVKKILTEASSTISRTYSRAGSATVAKFQNITPKLIATAGRGTKYVDAVFTDMIKAFNNASDTYNINLFNGITGRPLVESTKPSAKKEPWISLGHKVVPLKNATLESQLNVTETPLPENVMNNATKTIGKKKALTLEEIIEMDKAAREKVKKTGIPISVVAYAVGAVLMYSTVNTASKPKQYLYQGIIPEKERKDGQSYCYVLSEYPPSIQEDKVVLQKASNAPIDLSEPIQRRVIKRVFPKFRIPKAIKEASNMDMAIVGTSIGIGTIGLSSLALLL